MLSRPFRIIAVALTALCIVFILANGASAGDKSSSLSAYVRDIINSALSIFGDISVSEHFVRKLAHFTEYSVLGMLATLAAASNIGTRWKPPLVWIPISISAAVAGCDELIQLFTPGRYGCLSDVLLDLSGVMWAAALTAVISAIYIKKHYA